MTTAYTMKEILGICDSRREEFETITKSTDYEWKGIFNSELLMVCAFVDQISVKHVLESGLARGHSTSVMAKYFESRNITIDTIEKRKFSDDSIFSKKHLAKFEHVNIHYGDAFSLMPELVSEECVVVIDGPKGLGALSLASIMLENPKVRAVFIHDVHKDSDARDTMIKMYPNALFSDNEDFVHSFKDLDSNCWERQSMREELTDWGPYKRGARVMQSYSATMGLIINQNIDTTTREEIKNILKLTISEKPRIGGKLLGWLFPEIGLKTYLINCLVSPYWYFKFHFL